MKIRCYFCKVWLNNSIPVVMYDGRIVQSCHVCRGLVADAKPIESQDASCLSNTSGGFED